MNSLVPLASGYLSGKYRVGAQFPANDVRAGHDEAQVRETLTEVERIQHEEVPDGVSMASWALAWCLKQPHCDHSHSGMQEPGTGAPECRCGRVGDMMQ